MHSLLPIRRSLLVCCPFAPAPRFKSLIYAPHNHETLEILRPARSKPRFYSPTPILFVRPTPHAQNASETGFLPRRPNITKGGWRARENLATFASQATGPGQPRQPGPGGSLRSGNPSLVLRAPIRDYSSTWMFFFRQISLSCFGHTVTLTSPRCALRSSSIVVRDCPIPPPIDSGIWSFRIA